MSCDCQAAASVVALVGVAFEIAVDAMAGVLAAAAAAAAVVDAAADQDQRTADTVVGIAVVDLAVDFV